MWFGVAGNLGGQAREEGLLRRNGVVLGPRPRDNFDAMLLAGNFLRLPSSDLAYFVLVCFPFSSRPPAPFDCLMGD